MRSKVGEHTATGLLGLSPTLFDRWPEAVPVRLEQINVAELRQELAHRQKVAVEPPVVKDCEYSLSLPRKRDQRVGFFDCDRERLVDHHVLAGHERCAGDRI